jgi:hypothetical protein
VNLMAFPTRFTRICRRRRASPQTVSGHSGWTKYDSVSFFDAASEETDYMVSVMSWRKGK